MKAIMMSKKPKECMNILNIIQSLIVSRTCPKDWKDYLCGKTNIKPKPMIVFIYCNNTEGQAYLEGKTIVPNGFKKNLYLKEKKLLNGKVVAKFTLNKVEEIACNHVENGVGYDYYYMTETIDNIETSSCLSNQELKNYLGTGNNLCSDIVGYAWYIDNLVIFDKPKELREFYAYWGECDMHEEDLEYWSLTKPFQSWGYVEVME